MCAFLEMSREVASGGLLNEGLLMPSFKIDLSTAVVFVATAPEPKLVNKRTGERAVDQENRALSTVGLLVSDEGRATCTRSPFPRPVSRRTWCRGRRWP